MLGGQVFELLDLLGKLVLSSDLQEAQVVEVVHASNYFGVLLLVLFLLASDVRLIVETGVQLVEDLDAVHLGLLFANALAGLALVDLRDIVLILFFFSFDSVKVLVDLLNPTEVGVFNQFNQVWVGICFLMTLAKELGVVAHKNVGVAVNFEGLFGVWGKQCRSILCSRLLVRI